MRSKDSKLHHGSRILYFPGCAMKDQARGYEEGALGALAKLGYAVEELPRWNCCGTVYSLASDDLMRHVGPVRNLIRAQELGEERLLTLCAMCYNTLSRSARFAENEDHLKRINAFMDEEADYRGGVKVVHLLSFLRDEVGLEALQAQVVRPLSGFRVGAYYGCTLLRPREVGIDDPDRPEVMEGIISALGGEPVPFPERTECCGAYLTATRPEVVRERTGAILLSAAREGAELLVVSCPLCQFNLEERRPLGAPTLPIVYLGELLAWALGLEVALPKPAEELLAQHAVLEGS